MMFCIGAAARVENKGYLCDLCKTLDLRKWIDGRLEDDATGGEDGIDFRNLQEHLCPMKCLLRIDSRYGEGKRK